jgi:hypothetical protein
MTSIESEWSFRGRPLSASNALSADSDWTTMCALWLPRNRSQFRTHTFAAVARKLRDAKLVRALREAGDGLTLYGALLGPV